MGDHHKQLCEQNKNIVNIITDSNGKSTQGTSEPSGEAAKTPLRRTQSSLGTRMFGKHLDQGRGTLPMALAPTLVTDGYHQIPVDHTHPMVSHVS